MTDNNRIHKGSLQFYPRVRAKKVIPRVNWGPVEKETKKEGVGFLGFVGYKAGMMSASVKDETEKSMTKGKNIVIPVTILECPLMKIYSIRFYNKKKLVSEVVVSNEKILSKKIKNSKKIAVEKIDSVKEFDDLRVILYSDVKSTVVDKNKPDMFEVALFGSDASSKLEFVKEKIGKEILVNDVFSNELVDVRGVTKGFGTQGPVKRFGIALKDHKSEKGRRRPGSLAPWHPARVTFRAPQAGQTGYHNRITYNKPILEVASIKEKDINKKSGFDHYGIIKSNYVVLAGSVPGPQKRGLVITPAIKKTKNAVKKKYTLEELR